MGHPDRSRSGVAGRVLRQRRLQSTPMSLFLPAAIKDEYAVAAAQGDLGAVYQNQERLIEAQRAYDSALSIFRGLGDKTYEIAVVLRDVGSLRPARNSCLPTLTLP